MSRRHRDRERHADYRAAITALPLLNWGRKQHETLSMSDLFPSLEPKPVGPLPIEAQVQALIASVNQSGGTVIRR